ncbi:MULTISPECIES: hypothetical protein [unclassified Thiocapsa]|uniref:hypothetical protein n=1 Tax=unclassified Thiocapsa TaxID=2641286 RepID=UPI0035B1DCD7
MLDDAERPLGLIHEVDIKEYIYSNYGRELIVNPAFSRSLRDFARPCPVVDIFLFRRAAAGGIFSHDQTRP